MRTPVIITDLDACLLDAATYDPGPALPVLDELRRRDIPVVICSSKTRVEIEYHRRRWGITDPFISENGGGIYWKAGTLGPYTLNPREGNDVKSLPLGCPYPELRWTLVQTRRRYQGPVIGFGDMSVEEVSAETGLDRDAARRAKAREFDEPFRVLREEEEEVFVADLQSQGFTCHRGGRYWHLTGGHDKGQAVRRLIELYRVKWGEAQTVGLGDGENDLSLLQAVDIPVIVRSPREEDTAALRQALPQAFVTDAVGPAGWVQAVTDLILTGR